jgi:hypothetical protein
MRLQLAVDKWMGLNRYVRWVYAYGLVSVGFWFSLYFGFRYSDNTVLSSIYFSGLGYRSSLVIAMTAITHSIVWLISYAKSSSDDFSD